MTVAFVCAWVWVSRCGGVRRLHGGLCKFAEVVFVRARMPWLISPANHLPPPLPSRTPFPSRPTLAESALPRCGFAEKKKTQDGIRYLGPGRWARRKTPARPQRYVFSQNFQEDPSSDPKDILSHPGLFFFLRIRTSTATPRARPPNPTACQIPRRLGSCTRRFPAVWHPLIQVGAEYRGQQTLHEYAVFAKNCSKRLGQLAGFDSYGILRSN